MNIKSEVRWLILIVLFGFGVFSNTLKGDFVYDDRRQILRNSLIQNSTLYGKALTSDVWAFKGDGTTAASNYWRPTFVAWMIVNYAVFGAEPFGWHLLNILLHVAVCVLAFLLLRRWNLSPAVSFAISLIFAVHPAHVESVAWISGAPDLLFALFLLLSFWFTENAARGGKTLDLITAVLFYALALGSKEIGILCFPVFVLIFSDRNRAAPLEAETSAAETNKKSKPKKKAENVSETNLSTPFNRALPFLAAAVVYFVLRLLILGALSLPVEDAVGFGTALLSVPSIFVFYVRQIAFPYAIAANYPQRAVYTFGLTNFILPLIVSAAVLFFLWLAAKRSFVQKIGLALFVLPLLPAMNASAFVPEQIVHDRYLYLPLLGFLMIVFPYLAGLLKNVSAAKRELIVAAVAVVLSLPLAYAAFTYNRVWASEMALWRHSVTADPTSSFNWSQLGAELTEQKQTNEAIAAYANSLKIHPSAGALMGVSRNLLAQKKFQDAEKNLKIVIAMPNENVNAYTLYQSYEALTIAFVEQKKTDEAAKILTDARRRLPMYQAALTEKLAVVLYQANRKDEALRELEAVKAKARAELLLESKSVFLRLGMLYAEAGRRDEARANLQEFLSLTVGVKDENTLAERNQASELLKQMP